MEDKGTTYHPFFTEIYIWPHETQSFASFMFVLTKYVGCNMKVDTMKAIACL